MSSIRFDYKQALIDEHELAQLNQLLLPEIERVKQARFSGYETDYASVNLPFDMRQLQEVQKVIDAKRKLAPTVLVIVGIGGSNLGTLAVQQALYGMLYNEQQPTIKLYYADTIDSDYINDIVLLAQQALEKDETVLINLVSKSGATTESVANFEIFTALLKNYYGDEYHHYVVVTTDAGSKLEEIAQQEKCTTLAIPKKVGGRYSVLSAVGLFPLGMIGVDLSQLLAGAASIVDAAINTDMHKNQPAMSAALLYAQYQQSVAIHNSFIFSVDLQGIGAWYRQLMAESIGKEQVRSGAHKRVGIVPTVSIGSTDLHSQAQLYLAGPYVTYTTFITVEKNKSDVVIPVDKPMEKLVANIQGKPLASLMDAILQGVTAAYTKNKRPFCTITIPEKTDYYIGQLLQWKMMEIIYLGALLEVNVFDQPQVELYKQETRKILAHE